MENDIDTEGGIYNLEDGYDTESGGGQDGSEGSS